MEKKRWLDQFCQPGDDRTRIHAACELVGHLDDPQVVDCLCRTALRTRSRDLREGVLATLRFEAGGAGRRLAEAATRSADPMIRRRAFVCLRRLECRSAVDAVMKGLQDASGPVRRAAALNVGLYDDPSLWEAFRIYVRHNEDAFLRECCRCLWETFRDGRRRGIEPRGAAPEAAMRSDPGTGPMTRDSTAPAR